MKKSLRLSLQKDFERVYNEGKALFGKDLNIYFFKRDEERGIRIGIVVGKALGKATERNRVKRVLREILRRKASQLKEGYDIVVVAKPSVKERDFSGVEKAVQALLEEAKLLKEEE